MAGDGAGDSHLLSPHSPVRLRPLCAMWSVPHRLSSWLVELFWKVVEPLRGRPSLAEAGYEGGG